MVFLSSTPAGVSPVGIDTANARASARSSIQIADNAVPMGIASGSAVSWSAVFAGAAAASALSLILLLLGTGLGLSSVSPWANAGIAATALGVSGILWVTFAQLVASGMGGYLAGRLRTKYVAVHTDEVYFRDTAHGFLTWAVATLATASVLASAVGTVIGAGTAVAGGVASTAATAMATAGGVAATTAAATTPNANGGTSAPQGGSATDPMAYVMDSMFRKSPGFGVSDGVTAGGSSNASVAVSGAVSGSVSSTAASVNQDGSASASEITRIFVNSMKRGALPPEDAKYVASAVSARTGASPADAEARVQAAYAGLQTKLREAEASARQAADTARKLTAYAALWLFISMLIGAFFASWGATWGGRHRDL